MWLRCFFPLLFRFVVVDDDVDDGAAAILLCFLVHLFPSDGAANDRDTAPPPLIWSAFVQPPVAAAAAPAAAAAYAYDEQDMIDDALLRPGRLEVHVEIGLPDEAGRLQILQIHTRGMVGGGLGAVWGWAFFFFSSFLFSVGLVIVKLRAALGIGMTLIFSYHGEASLLVRLPSAR